MKNKLKTTLLTTLLFVPILFVGNGFNNSMNNNTQINNMTSREGGDVEDYGKITQFRSSGQGSYGFVSKKTKDKKATDHLYMWGRNDDGELGTGKRASDSTDIKILPIDITTKGAAGGVVGGIKPLTDDQKITQFSMGYWHSGIVIEDAKKTKAVPHHQVDHLWMWGDNLDGQVGKGYTDPAGTDSPTPTEIELPLLKKGGKITELKLTGYNSEAKIEVPAKQKVNGVMKLGVMQHTYVWGAGNSPTPTEDPAKTKFIINATSLTPPPTPPIYVTTKANTLPYIIAGSVLGLLLLIAIIVSGIFYGKYKNEKTRKQLI